MYSEIIRLKLKKEREEADMTQQELADKCGISRGIISKIELGLRQPDVETIGILSEFYNIPTDYFFGLGKKTND